MTATIFGKHSSDMNSEFLTRLMSHLTSWRGRGLSSVLQPAPSGTFIHFKELSSLYSVMMSDFEPGPFKFSSSLNV